MDIDEHGTTNLSEINSFEDASYRPDHNDSDSDSDDGVAGTIRSKVSIPQLVAGLLNHLRIFGPEHKKDALSLTSKSQEL